MQIEQIDRDAAARVHERSCYEIVRIQGAQCRNGYGDTDPLVQDFARHRLAALSARPVGDYVLVPVEPTEAMIEAGYVAYARKADDVWSVTPTEEPWAGGGAMGYAYRAMIAARPDSDMVERVLSAIEDTGLLAGDEARDAARAAIAAMGSDMGESR